MERERLESGAASLLAVIAAMCGAYLLLRGFGVVKYERELVINLPGLFILTVLFSVPGTVLLLVALAQAAVGGRVRAWSVAAAVGTAVACAACVAIAFAADCVPQCEGRGSLQEALMIAVPAGFSAGALCFGVWALCRRLVAGRGANNVQRSHR